MALYPFLKVSFPSQRALRDVAQGILEEQKETPWGGKRQEVPIPADVAALIHRATVESQINPCQKFRDDWKLTPCGWFQISAGAIAFASLSARRTHCAYEGSVRNIADAQLKPLPLRLDIPPLLLMSFDIECDSEFGRVPARQKCPRPVHHDRQRLLAVYGGYQGPDLLRGDAVPEGRPIPRGGAPEASATRSTPSGSTTSATCCTVGGSWSASRSTPTCQLGYNISGFDLKFLFDRMQLLCTGKVVDTPGKYNRDWKRNSPELIRYQQQQRLWKAQRKRLDLIPFFHAGRFIHEFTSVVEKTQETRAYGQRKSFDLTLPGRVVFDLLPYLRKQTDVKLSNYELKTVAKKFLKIEKLDLHHKEIFKAFHGDAYDRGRISVYCARDCEIPIAVMRHRVTITKEVEMSRVTETSLHQLVTRGQQIKVFNQIIRFCRQKNYLIDVETSEDANKDLGYEGATVLEPTAGFYEVPVTTCDYESLYPSIMISYNTCFSTLVHDPRQLELIERHNIPVHHVEISPEERYVFVRHIKGILPEILKTLLKARKQAKADMESARGTHLFEIYNGRQNALKISCNSVYGFTGAGHGMFSCKPIATTVTCKGRGIIELTKRTIEHDFPGAEVIYGDSVTADTPILFRIGDGEASYRTIEKLCDDRWEMMLEKQFQTPQSSEAYVWSDLGWTRLLRVIRHRCSKQIYRILTRTGCVDVTADHSLLDAAGQKVCPKDLSVGDRLLHHDLPTKCDNLNHIGIQKPFTVDVRGKLAAAGLFYLYSLNGYSVTLEKS